MFFSSFFFCFGLILNLNCSESQAFLDSNEFTMSSKLIDAVLSDSRELLEAFIKGNMHNVRERVVSFVFF